MEALKIPRHFSNSKIHVTAAVHLYFITCIAVCAMFGRLKLHLKSIQRLGRTSLNGSSKNPPTFLQFKNSNQDGFNCSLRVGLLLSAASILSYTSQSEQKEEEWPVFRRSEIAKHNKLKDAWVTYQGNVYNMSSFIPNHPGGSEKILLAAGGDLESYWNLYRQHFNSPLPMEILSKLQIGILHPDDLTKEEEAKELSNNANSQDPYDRDPSLSPLLQVLTKQPINAEAPASLLTDTYITPNELFFIRNHHPVPHLDKAKYHVKISLQRDGNRQYEQVASLSMTELQQKYDQHTITTSIQCGGNRRWEMTEFERTNGSSWKVSAISTAEWSGVRLRDVLLSILGSAKITENDIYENRSPYQHVHFVGVDGMEASIPLKKALRIDGDVMLALEMNHADIPLEHGHPLRAVVPGHVGVRNVKWVQEIRLSKEEAYGTWQRGMAYKGFGPSVKSLEKIDVEAIPSLQEQPVTSAITAIQQVEDQGINKALKVKGYAYSGGGRGIVRVDVSMDQGVTWQTAQLKQGSQQPLDRAWAWTFWETEFPINQNQKEVTIICKATDASYNVQPDSVQGIWNLRGINNNAWHRIRYNLP
jgi:sulfite oxidase